MIDCPVCPCWCRLNRAEEGHPPITGLFGHASEIIKCLPKKLNKIEITNRGKGPSIMLASMCRACLVTKEAGFLAVTPVGVCLVVHWPQLRYRTLPISVSPPVAGGCHVVVMGFDIFCHILT